VIDDDLGAAEQKARRLLWWATVLAFVAITVCGLDIMIKNQILRQAKESQGWLADSTASLDRLRRDLAHGFPGEDSEPGTDDSSDPDPGHPGVAGMGGVRAGAQPDPGQDAGV
jgi:hypothetical protein